MVTFEPGTIKAVCRNAARSGNSCPQRGTEREPLPTYELKTAGPPAKILLTIDKTRLTNDWNDVVFVTATIVDANGVPVPDADNMITFNARGSGSSSRSTAPTIPTTTRFKQHIARRFRAAAWRTSKPTRRRATLSSPPRRGSSNTVTITVTK